VQRLKVLLAGGLLAAGVLAACADIFGIQNGVLLDGGMQGGPTDAPIDVPYDYMTRDAITLDVNTAVCGDAGIPIETTATWVSARGSDAPGCGAPGAPCATIAHALGLGVKYLYLDQSTFNETLVLDNTFAGYTLQGGWFRDDAGTWDATCNNGLATIQGQDDAGSAAVDIQGATNITFRLLTIQSKVNGAPGTGESVYAVRVIDTTGVTLDNVTMLAQNAAQGVIGGMGTNGTNCGSSPGQTGADGSAGAPGDAGMFTNNGFVPSFAGTGTNGQEGQEISIGAAGQCGFCGACQ
jgi:hypothetical protein